MAFRVKVNCGVDALLEASEFCMENCKSKFLISNLIYGTFYNYVCFIFSDSDDAEMFKTFRKSQPEDRE